MILCGQKREEYREDNPYYRSRFEKLFDLSPEALADPVRQKASVLRLRNGYNAAAAAAPRKTEDAIRHFVDSLAVRTDSGNRISDATIRKIRQMAYEMGFLTEEGGD